MILAQSSAELIEQVGSQPSRRAVASFLRQQKNLWDPAVVETLYASVVRVARMDLRQAERLAEAATWLAEKLHDARCRAQSMRAVGHVLLIRRRYSEAHKHYKAALRLFRRLSQDVDVGRTLSGGALQTLIYLGRYDEALAAAREARRLFERHGDRLRLARLDTNVGNILTRQNRFQEALTFYQRAREPLERLGEPQDVAAVLGNLAMCYTYVNQLDTAQQTYQEARHYCETHAMPLLIAQVDYNIAYLHYLRGEYSRALELYRAAEKQSERVGDQYHRSLCDLDRSEIFLELNLSDEGGELASRALAGFDTLGTAYEKAKSLTNLAIAASHDNDVDRALELFDRARVLFAKERNHVRLALVDFYQALVLYRNGRYLQAQRLCQQAFKLFAKTSASGQAVLCELLLAQLELDAGDPRAAERACRLALGKATAMQSPILSYQAYFVLGLISEAQHDPHGAFAAFEKARGRLERLRSHLGAEDLKVSFLKDKLAVYEGLVSIGLTLGAQRHRQEQAFGYIEQAKSRSLADLIAFRGSAIAPHVESELTDEIRNLRQQINAQYRQIELNEGRRDKRSARRVEALRQHTRTLENRLVKSLNAVSRTDQEFAALQGGTSFTVDEIREVLGAETVLLEYYQARGQIYACVLSAEALDVLPVASGDAVRKVLRLLQFQLSKVGLRSTAGKEAERRRGAMDAHLSELYTMLVGPVRDLLRTEQVVIVPHEMLHYLPFHALFDGDRFLTDAYKVSYAPSASVYRLCCAKRARVQGEPLVMGVPDERAPYIADEVQAVANTFPGARVFIGADATADRLSVFGPTSPFVHIATHGRFRRDNPMFSSIRLGNGPFNVIDLYQLRLSAELVTLSGCSTGLNAIVGGDELLGLVRGLLYAGAGAVLLTLWDAFDRSTAEFMETFYRELQAGSTKAGAVQLAMRQLRERYPHPFYWAPFVLVGQGSVC
jgi:CHAT domain-containing protein/tetratricopeptide (TPR) repeat protein